MPLRPDPARRARQVETLVALGGGPPPDPLERALWRVLRNEDADEDQHIREAWELWCSPYRHVLDAALITHATPDMLTEALGLSTDTLAAYAVLCFDRRAFPHVFAARDYVRSIPFDNTEEYKSYELALMEGPEPLLDRYRLGDAPAPTPEKVMERALAEQYSRAREHRQRPLSNRIAQESLKLNRSMADTAAQLAEAKRLAKGAGDRTTALILALTQVDSTVPSAASPVPVQELVRTGPKDP